MCKKMNEETNEETRLILEANQLLLRDRLWNNQVFEVQSKITDANISKLLNPIKEPTQAEKTEEYFGEDKFGSRKE